MLCECKTWTPALSGECKAKVIENRAQVFTACWTKRGAQSSTERPTSDLEVNFTKLLVLYLETPTDGLLVGNELGRM